MSQPCSAIAVGAAGLAGVAPRCFLVGAYCWCMSVLATHSSLIPSCRSQSPLAQQPACSNHQLDIVAVATGDEGDENVHMSAAMLASLISCFREPISAPVDGVPPLFGGTGSALVALPVKCMTLFYASFSGLALRRGLFQLFCRRNVCLLDMTTLPRCGSRSVRPKRPRLRTIAKSSRSLMG